MGLKHTNESNKSKSVVNSNKDITNYKPLGKNEPLHIYKHKTTKKSNLEK